MVLKYISYVSALLLDSIKLLLWFEFKSLHFERKIYYIALRLWSNIFYRQGSRLRTTRRVGAGVYINSIYTLRSKGFKYELKSNASKNNIQSLYLSFYIINPPLLYNIWVSLCIPHGVGPTPSPSPGPHFDIWTPLVPCFRDYETASAEF